MRFYDFEYDGLLLSDMGYIVCDFGSKGLETVNNGADINFNTIPFFYGTKHELINTNYNDCLTATFQICKNPCNDYTEKITVEEFNRLNYWLNRKKFYKFKIINDEYEDIFFEASFNIRRIEFGGEIYGLELEMKTNRPYGLKETILNSKTLSAGGSLVVNDLSNEEGFIYPNIEITLGDNSGTLTIQNSLSNEVAIINGCSAGEKITFNYPMITSSLSVHKIQDAFNWNFPKLINTFSNQENEFTFSLGGVVKISYNPIVKIGI